jgi:hypothetical protein
MAFAVLAFLTPRYETNDDATMNAIVAGRIYVDHPDEHLVFSNVLLGLALKGLYQTAPTVPWYGGYLFITASLSIAAVSVVCLNRADSPVKSWLTGVVLCVVGVPYLVSLQFTRVAFLATLAGILLLASPVWDWRPARHTAWAIPFLVIGSLIRFESFLLAGLVLSPLVAWMAWRARFQAGARWALLVLAGAIAIGLMLFGMNRWYYERDPAWRGFYRFNALRAAFTDYGHGEFNEQTAPVYSSVGWTQVDVEMLKNWCFLDRERYNTQTLQKVLDGLASCEHATEARPWSGLLQLFFGDSELLALWVCGAIVLIVTAGGTAPLIIPAGCYAIAAGVCLYLYRDLHLPARVYSPVFGACVAVTLLLSATPRFIEMRKRWTASIIARGAVVTILGALLAWRGIVLLQENGTFLAARRQATQMMKLLNPRPDYLFVIWGTEFPSEKVVLPLDWDDGTRNFKVLSFGWPTQTPFSKARMDRLGVSDLYSILRRHRGVYFISHMSENGLLSLYFRVHYGLKIGYGVVLSHPALGECAVYSLAITGSAPRTVQMPAPEKVRPRESN